MSRQLVRIPEKIRNVPSFMARAAEAGRVANILTHVVVVYMLLRTYVLLFLSVKAVGVEFWNVSTDRMHLS